MSSMLNTGHDAMIAMVLAGVLEGLGVPWPGAALLAGLGVAAENSWSVLCLLATAFTVAYCAGSYGQYIVGRFIGPKALGWLPSALRQRLEGAFHRYGALSVLWTRPVAIGNYVSLPAGMARMPLGTFLGCTFLGSWPWAFSMVALGRLVGDQVGGLGALIQPYILPALGLCMAVGLLSVGRKYWQMRQQAAAVDVGLREHITVVGRLRWLLLTMR